MKEAAGTAYHGSNPPKVKIATKLIIRQANF
jgi:hypothetical protein